MPSKPLQPFVMFVSNRFCDTAPRCLRMGNYDIDVCKNVKMISKENDEDS